MNFVVEHFGCRSTVRCPKQCICKRDAMTSRTQSRTTQQALNVSLPRHFPALTDLAREAFLHDVGNPGIGTLNVCRINRTLRNKTVGESKPVLSM